MYLRQADVEEAPLQSELMLYKPSTAQFYMLNPTMAHIWRNCGSAQSLDALVGSVKDGFDGADGAEVESDVRKAVEELVSLGLLVDTAQADL